MTKRKDIVGAGGGGSSRTPKESPNTLRSVALATIVDLVSEGPIVGLADGLKSIILDETPVENSDGSLNFSNFEIQYRLGTQDQDFIPGFDSVENEIGVGVELRATTPWVRTFTNSNIDGVRVRLSVQALHKTNKENGDISGHNVGIRIERSTDGGPWTVVHNAGFTGKTMSKYERDYYVPFESGDATSSIRVTRITPNADNAYTADTTYIESVIEVIEAKLRYPNSAIMATTIDSQQFQSIPARAYDIKGRIIRVPSNYDPETRNYSGIWDGTFKLEWTDNPAWIYYDLITHPRYGLGHLLTDLHVNKWMLYNIARYCDELVPNGLGGLEPRFTCNLYLQSQEEAYKVLQDLASVFRGITYWANGEIMAVSDKPEEPVFVYSPANVINGSFIYEGTPRKTRYNVALVSWNDPDNMGRAAIEYIDDGESIVRYGIQQTDATAVGCSSRSQAQRVGRYILATSRYETQSVSFKVGLDSTLVQPGKVVLINDPLRSGVRLSGRVVASSTVIVTVDGEAGLIEIGDTLRVMQADGTMESRQVTQIVGNQLTVNAAYTAAPESGAMWIVERANLKPQLFRIISVTDEGNGTFGVAAVRQEPGKFDYVDYSTIIEQRPESQMPANVQSAPTNLVLTHYEAAAYVTTSMVLVASWDAAPEAVEYEVDYRRDNGEWNRLPRTTGTTVDIRDCWHGVYDVRVRAINAIGVMSLPRVSQPYLLAELSTPPKFANNIVSEVIESFNGLPNFVSREEMLEVQQHMLTMGTLLYEEASLSAGAKYDVSRFRIALDDVEAKVVRSESSVADGVQVMVELATTIGARMGDMEAQLYHEQSVRASADSALASSITALQASVSDSIAAQIVLEQQARASADDALASDLTQLSTRVGDAETMISNESTARSNADEALGQTIGLIGAKNTAGTAFIIDLDRARVSATETFAERLNSISSNTGAFEALLNSEAQTRANADNALSSLISLLGAKNAAGTAFIMDLNKAYVDNTTSWAVRLNNISSSIATAQADITNEISARTSADSAITNSINSMSSTLNGHTASINAQSNTINGLSAQYTVKVDNNGYISGFGLASTPINGTPYSTFRILADKFQIVSPAGGQRTEYSGGNWRVYDSNGTLRVRMGVW